jgi:hypothetical protein
MGTGRYFSGAWVLFLYRPARAIQLDFGRKYGKFFTLSVPA